jgi:hypothetical protein
MARGWCAGREETFHVEFDVQQGAFEWVENTDRTEWA